MNVNFSLDHKHLLDNLNVGIIIHGKMSEIVYANHSALNMMDMTWAEMTGKTVSGHNWHLVDKYSKPLLEEHYPVSMVMTSGKPIENYELGVMNKGSITSWILCNANPEFDKEGVLIQIVVTIQDITCKHESVPFKKIVDLANDIIVVTEAKRTEEEGHKIVYVNNAFTALTGYSEGEAIGKSPKMLQGEMTSADTRNRIGIALAKQQEISERIYNYTKEGKGYWLDMNIMPLHNSYGELLYFAAIERDITDQQEKEDTLSVEASIDGLTGLLNRRAFNRFADNAFNTALTQKHSLAVAMIDVDHFKNVNDSYGHDVGDKALFKLAQIMKSSFRKSDLLGRFGGEEFIMVISGCEEEKVLRKMNEFRERVSNSAIEITSTSSINLTISIGLSFLAKADDNFEGVVKKADTALYKAKSGGRNRVCI
jgi:diguanylate cyclase (GGDEF)-like protein/PAS domain S-box-containing protein